MVRETARDGQCILMGSLTSTGLRGLGHSEAMDWSQSVVSEIDI